MGKSFKSIDRIAESLARFVIRFRWLVVVAAVLITVAIGSGGRFLEFSNNYRVFFSDENPELVAFEELQATYTKNDNFYFVMEPADGDAFSQETLAAVEQLTEAAWQIPFALRVDSLTNFQHTYGVDDDLIVEDLFAGGASMDAAERERRGNIALAEPLIRDQLVKSDGSVTAVNVTLQYPQESLTEVPEAVAVARALRDEIETDYPNIDVSLTGVSMLNNTFSETGTADFSNLVPMMFGVILLLTLIILRSVTATLATFFIILFSSMVGMGWAGFMGIKLTPISGSAPIVILTLAIADSIHILMSMRTLMRDGMEKEPALIEALRLNFMPVTITSLTTIVGFLALNFSDAPPFWHLGNITAVGILAAWALSITLLPALIRIFPFNPKKAEKASIGERSMERLANFVIDNPKRLLLGVGSGVLILIAFIPTIDLNDLWTEYFDHRVEFRNETDQAVKHFGLYSIEFSVKTRESGGISEPEYLAYLDEFAEFLREQEKVTHVFSLSDIMKRLNKNLHGDDQSFYAIPEDRNLSAQYLLLYELSLPYGLDLNDRINIDKSATRVTATLGNVDSVYTRQFVIDTRAWMEENLPSYMTADPTSAQVMFTYIAERNVQSMLVGTTVAIFAIALILTAALRSFRLGLLSLVPNGLPILATFGTWAILVGTVGFSVAIVASISLGIVVDDTVHLLSKYVRARDERGGTAADAIRYAFKSVGIALIVNTFILTLGFAVMMTSSFKPNVDMGMLTVLAIVFALVLDFLFLPALLLMMDRDKTQESTVGGHAVSNVQTEPAAASTASSIVGVTLLAVMGTALLASPSFADDAVTEVRGETENERRGFEISARADRSDRGFGDSEVELEMILRNAAGKESRRTLKISTLEVADERVGDKSLVVFDSPNDVKGTALLSHANILDPDDQWLFLPALKRVKRISSANKSGPFVGSEFAFEDFTAQELNKYDYKWLREEEIDGVMTDAVERLPRYQNSGYTRQIGWVDRDIDQVRKVEFYDRRGDLLKTLTLTDYREYDGIWRSHRFEMINHKTGKSTIMNYSGYKFGLGLNESDFVKGRLARLR